MLTLNNIKTVSVIIKDEKGANKSSRNYQTPLGGLDFYNQASVWIRGELEQGQHAVVLGLGFAGGKTQVIARNNIFS
jgi:hypothetical protein